MKQLYQHNIFTNRRKIVIHHIYEKDNIMSKLVDNDIVFFDDCLFSQYSFLVKNIESFRHKRAICILGLSTSLMRNKDANGISNILSAVLHDKVHNRLLEYLAGFMTLDEVKELLLQDFIYLACHGNWHLDLEHMNLSNILRILMFNEDVACATKLLKDYNLATEIFVYPYAYSFYSSDAIVRKHGYKYIYASKDTKRIPIEAL